MFKLSSIKSLFSKPAVPTTSTAVFHDPGTAAIGREKIYDTPWEYGETSRRLDALGWDRTPGPVPPPKPPRTFLHGKDVFVDVTEDGKPVPPPAYLKPKFPPTTEPLHPEGDPAYQSFKAKLAHFEGLGDLHTS